MRPSDVGPIFEAIIPMNMKREQYERRGSIGGATSRMRTKR
jgi:hypothetical protein